MKEIVMGVDIGGTNIKGAVVSGEGEILLKEKILTLAEEGKEKVVRRIIQVIENLREKAKNTKILGIGVGSPGPLNVKEGMVINPPNLPGWKNVPLARILKEKFNLPVFIDNDGNVACFGEKWVGGGKEVRTLICLTLGTGIGGGIILEGKIWHGIDDAGGELGHIIVEPDGPPCKCGGRGCLESVASASAVARKAREEIKKGRKSLMEKLVKGNIEEITSESVYQACLQEDVLAKEIINQTARYLGIGISSLINIFNPEMIVLGGGMMEMGNILLEPIREEVKRRTFPSYPVPYQSARIEKAELGEEAGVLGAAGIALFKVLGKKI